MNIEDLKNMNESELDELQDFLNNRKSKKIYQQHLDAIKENQKYIGKCYKEKKHEKYIYVLSSKSSNECRMECMCFEFPIKFFEENKFLTRIFNPENAFSNIDFESIYVEDYPLLCNGVLQSLEEISQEKYFSKMDEYIQELKKFIQEDKFNTSKK